MLRLFMILLITGTITFSQERESRFIALEGGIGMSRYLSTLSMAGLNKNGISASFAAFWHPEHLLEAGIETGFSYLYFYDNNEPSEYGMTQASASLTSMPVKIIFRMRVYDNFRLHAGSGIIFLFNRGEAFNEEFSSSLISIVDHIGVSYFYNLNRRILLGGSFKYTYIFREEESYISLQFNAAYKILEW
jgi:hypothetical protein